MKLTKRIIALTIVLCTLGAMMIPSVSAEDDPYLGVNFHEDFLKLGYPCDTSATKVSSDWATHLATFNSHYNSTDPDEKIEWTIYTDAEGNAVTNATAVSASKPTSTGQGGWQLNVAKASDTYGYLALKFRAPGDGMFKLSMRFDTCSKTDKAGCYILDLPEGDPYTTATLPVVTGDYVLPEGAKAPLETGYSQTGSIWKGDFPCDLYPDYTPVALEGGEEYILVLWFRSVTNPSGTPYSIFSWFQLDYEGPIVEKPDEEEKVYEASIGDTKYETLLSAIEAANAAEDDDVTIKVLTDVTTRTLAFSLDPNVTLDLNGKIVNAGYNQTVTAKITDSDVGGFLVAKNNSVLSSPADECIIWDMATANTLQNGNKANGWSVWDYTFKAEGIKDTSTESTTAKSFWATMNFADEAAYDRVTCGVGLNVQFGFEVQWTPVEGEPSSVKQFMIAGADMIEWANQQKATDDILSFFIDITGFEKIEEAGALSVTPIVKRGDSYKTVTYADTMTYTVG